MDILAVVGDTHTNSTLGLCPPNGIELDDGGTYKPSKLQRELWRAWKDYADTVAALKSEHGANVCTIFNGDISDGDHHNTSQIISRSENTMHKIAHRTLGLLYEQSDRVYVVRGTRVHRGATGSIEETFAEDIGAVQNKETGAYSWGHVYLKHAGIVVEAAHHGSMGRLPWTYPNAANKLASITMVNAANARRAIPDLAFRSHNHRYADSFDIYRTRAICLPGFQGKTEYVERIDPTAIPDIGGLIVLIDRKFEKGFEVIVKRYPFKPSVPRSMF